MAEALVYKISFAVGFPFQLDSSNMGSHPSSSWINNIVGILEADSDFQKVDICLVLVDRSRKNLLKQNRMLANQNLYQFTFEWKELISHVDEYRIKDNLNHRKNTLYEAFSRASVEQPNYIHSSVKKFVYSHSPYREEVSNSRLRVASHGVFNKKNSRLSFFRCAKSFLKKIFSFFFRINKTFLIVLAWVIGMAIAISILFLR